MEYAAYAEVQHYNRIHVPLQSNVIHARLQIGTCVTLTIHLPLTGQT
jgi:hypothetical protein